MNGSNYKNMVLMIILAVLLVGTFSYTIIANKNNLPIVMDLPQEIKYFLVLFSLFYLVNII